MPMVDSSVDGKQTIESFHSQELDCGLRYQKLAKFYLNLTTASTI